MCRIADQHDAASMPTSFEDVALEPGVVDLRGIAQLLPDLVPGPVILRGQVLHHRESFFCRRVRVVLRGLDDVGVQRVLTGRAVACDESCSAVIELGTDDACRTWSDQTPDTHSGALGLEFDPECATRPRPHPVRADHQVVVALGAIRERDRCTGLAVHQSIRDSVESNLRSRAFGSVVQDSGEDGSFHAHSGRKIRSTGAGVVHLDDDSAEGVGGTDPDSVESVAACPNLVPDPELSQCAQRVALQSDSGPARARPWRGLDDVHGRSASSQCDAHCRPGDSGSDDQHRCHDAVPTTGVCW